MPNVKFQPGPIPYSVRPEGTASFAIPPQPARLKGPGAIVRFVNSNAPPPPPPAGSVSRYAGEFWFDANLLQLVRCQAYDELTKQRREARQPMANTLASMIGLYLRLYLRPNLAVRKDWKENFEAYVSLELQPSDSLYALVGPIAEQPYYSPADPRHVQAAASGIALSGGVTQYYVNFNHRPNLPLAERITGPVYF
jgi:hypothetical protein